MKPLSERDENLPGQPGYLVFPVSVGMKPLSERDENVLFRNSSLNSAVPSGRNEATL